MKWLLAIPHYIVLAFLWLAFLVVTVIAFFAILFTGRYPRWLFDFNVGVLRWSWRVGFYSFSALGTDRYPPFSLGPADYPATLDVAYPERSSPGVWCWSSGGCSPSPTTWSSASSASGGGSAGGAATTRGWNGPDSPSRAASGSSVCWSCSPASRCSSAGATRPGLFAFVMGINRWIYRVAAYVMLMTDVYPPFRLDQGEDEPVVAPRRRRDAGTPESDWPAPP